MAIARDAKSQDHKIIAVIGDGGITAGMSYEALCHAGYLKKDMLVVLNDNEMSIIVKAFIRQEEKRPNILNPPSFFLLLFF